MQIRDFEREYQIREFQVKSQRLQTELSWKFKTASHFLVFIYDSRYEFEIEEAVEMLEEEGITDKEIATGKPKTNLYPRENGKFQLYCVREKEFVQDKKTMVIPGQKLKKGIPYEISIYCCEYDAEIEELSLYLPEKPEDNRQYIPVIIQPEISYEKKLFSRTATCILKLPKLEEYRDGAIMYHVEGVKADIRRAV